MNGCEEEKPHCYFHPPEIIVGICALCLRERLLDLASKQGLLSPPHPTTQISSRIHHKKPSTNFPKVALRYFLHGSTTRQRRSSSSDPDTAASHEDSFISIKFEEDGRASWTHKTTCGISSEPLRLRLYNNMDEEPKQIKNMMEGVKDRKLRKLIGLLFHPVRWARWTKAKASCHAGRSKVEDAKHSGCCWTLGR